MNANKEKPRKLTAKQEAFARAVALKGMNYSDAYRSTYNTKEITEQSVWNGAWQVRKLEHVSSRISELQARAESRLLMSKQQYLEKLERMTMADMRTIFDPVGGVKEIQDIGDAEADCIEGIEVVENFEKVGDKAEHVGYTKKIKFTSKRALLKDYGEARGWLEEKQVVPAQQTNSVTVNYFALSKQEAEYVEKYGTLDGYPSGVLDISGNGHRPGQLQQINGRPDSGSEGAEDR